jgi:hypothetical protein
MRHWQSIAISLTLLLSMPVAAQSGWQQPGTIEQPHGKWQVPSHVQQPKTFANAGRTPGSKGHSGNRTGEVPLPEPDRGRGRRTI